MNESRNKGFLRRLRWIAAATLAIHAIPVAAGYAPDSVSTVQPFFGPGIDGSVAHAVTHSIDGVPVVFVGGNFRAMTEGSTAGAVLVVAPESGALHRLEPPIFGSVNAMVIHDGALVVGGSNLAAQGQPLGLLAIHRGDHWESIGPYSQQGHVSALASNGDTLAIGGNFSEFDGVDAAGFALWQDEQITAPPVGLVGGTGIETLAWHAGTWLAAGGFTATGAGLPVARVARLVGDQWQGLGAGISDGVVYDLERTANGNLIAAGTFSTLPGGAPARRVAVWDGSQWQGLDGGTLFGPNAVAVLDVSCTADECLFAGNFSGTDAPAGARGLVRRSAAGSWESLGAFELSNSAPGVVINAVRLDDHVVAAGNFAAVSGLVANGIAISDADTWIVPSGAGGTGFGLNSHVYAAIWTDTGMCVGGRFLGAGHALAHNVACWDGAQWSALAGGVPGSVEALARFGDSLIAGGTFVGNAGGTELSRIAAWDGQQWQAMGAGFNGAVHAVAVHQGRLYAAGEFTASGNIPLSYVARWNDTVQAWESPGAPPLPAAPNTRVHAMLSFGDELVLGGHLINTLGAPHLLRYDPQTDAWNAFSVGTSNSVLALAVHHGRVYAGGPFDQTSNGTPLPRVGEWTGADWIPLGGGVVGDVFALASIPHGLAVGGSFFGTENSFQNPRLALWTGDQWRSLPTPTGLVRALAAQDMQLLIGGQFGAIGPATSSRVAVLELRAQLFADGFETTPAPDVGLDGAVP